MELLLKRCPNLQNKWNKAFWAKGCYAAAIDNVTGCAENCLDLSDEWEYRRFVELILLAVPDLKESVLALGENSDN